MNTRSISAGLVGVIAWAMSGSDVTAQTERGPFARVAIMRALDGHAFELEAGYTRHLEWHRKVKDPFTWFSYTVWASSERQRWIVYATFGHSPASLGSPIAPAEDERDNVVNVLPHAHFAGNWVYEFLPKLSRGDANGVPSAGDRVEMVTIELKPGAADAFEGLVAQSRATLNGETLWYRLAFGGSPERYLRLRPRASLGALLTDRADVPAGALVYVQSITVEGLNLRRDMLVNVTP
jgi:hypothetical protein